MIIKNVFGVLGPLLVLLAFLPVSAAAQNRDKAMIEEQLRRVMAKEAPLSEADVKIYLENIKPIFRLSRNPALQKETIAAIGRWSENRFAYVAVKMAVGMSMLIRPDDPRNAAAPDFAKPTAGEMELIRGYRDELLRAAESASR
ncbi:MAG: hypothetical protein LBS31_11200 [Candidatus Adiutrix sp.]|jgi:hypothetical protein|nr:hypothetical protein [Candidatus Adiutrix sp.]